MGVLGFFLQNLNKNEGKNGGMVFGNTVFRGLGPVWGALQDKIR